MRLAIPLLVFLCGIPSAQAYHLAGDFEEVADKGGGGGLWFTGSPRWKKYDCTACHTGSPGVISLNIRTEPTGLFDTGRYEAGKTYTIRVDLLGEHAGLLSKSNLNQIGVEFITSDGEVAGSFDYDEAGFVEPVSELGVLFSQPIQDVTSWRFNWTAPAIGHKTVTLYLAGVDGNGNNIPEDDSSDAPGSDPRGDDVTTRQIVLRRADGMMGSQRPQDGDDRITGCGVGPTNTKFSLFWVLVLLALLPMRRRL